MKGRSYADVIRRLALESRVEAPPSLPADEQRLVAAVEQALRARARRRVLVRRGVSLTFAAAAALALVFGGRLRHPGAPGIADGADVRGATRGPHALTVLAPGDAPAGAVVAGASAPVALRSGMAIGVGLTLRAPSSGEVRVGTADGTSLALEAGGELTVTESGATQRFALRAGAVTARVSRLFAGERFLVNTSDAEVEVHGTTFRVAVVPGVAACGDGTTTRVSVTEGVVHVRFLRDGRDVSVPAGATWPDACDAAPTRADRSPDRARAHAVRARAAASAEPTPPAVEPAAPSAPPAKPARAPAPPPAPTSSLAAENDLFAAAVRAKKQGQLDEAVRLFGELVAAHPGSPLVESASVQRMKLLATIDPAAGARAAAAYLERYPSGFARPEAQELTRRSP